MKSILIVEDNIANYRLMHELLSLAYPHWTISIKTTAANLLLFLEGNAVDLIISDLSMPLVNGFEAIQRVRHSPHFRNLRCIAVSGNSVARAELERLGFDGFIRKPIRPENFAEQVGQIVLLGQEIWQMN